MGYLIAGIVTAYFVGSAATAVILCSCVLAKRADMQSELWALRDKLGIPQK